MEKRLISKEERASILILSIIFFVFGVLFLAFRSGFLNILFTIIGCLLFVYSIFLFFKHRPWLGLIILACSIVVLCGAWLFVEVILIIFGALLIIFGGYSFYQSAQRHDNLSVILAALAVIVGVFLIIAKFALLDWVFIVIGVIFIAYGIIDLVSYLTSADR